MVHGVWHGVNGATLRCCDMEPVKLGNHAGSIWFGITKWGCTWLTATPDRIDCPRCMRAFGVKWHLK